MQDDRVMRERTNKRERERERERKTWEFKGRLWGRVQGDRVMRERTNKKERVRERKKLENSREDFEGECKMIE